MDDVSEADMAHKKTQQTLRRYAFALPFLISLMSGFSLVYAEDIKKNAGEESSVASKDREPDFYTNLWTRSALLGDMGGLRSALMRSGITINLQETSEVMGNTTGGKRKQAAYQGLTTLTLGVDTLQAFGWEGGTFNVSGLQIHGRNLSAETLLNLQTVSGIESSRATRLWESWYQQAFFDGKVDAKIGKQAVDQEFMASQSSALYLNTMMGWPMIPSASLYGGGPAYPLASAGARLRAQLGSFTVLAGAFEDNPLGGSFDDNPQSRDRTGTNFGFKTGTLWMGEIQYGYNQPFLGQMAMPDQKEGYPGVYKIGVWYDTARFPDQRFGTDGLTLANGNNNAAMHKANYSLYGVVDQMVWRDAEGPRSINVFARPMVVPDKQNLVSFSLNAGVNLKAPIEGRDNDTVGIGYGFAKVGNRAIGLDRDQRLLDPDYRVRSNEQFIELTYQYQVAPWWIVQPDFQYIFRPAGGLANDDKPGAKIKSEAVLGVRTTITF